METESSFASTHTRASFCLEQGVSLKREPLRASQLCFINWSTFLKVNQVIGSDITLRQNHSSLPKFLETVCQSLVAMEKKISNLSNRQHDQIQFAIL